MSIYQYTDIAVYINNGEELTNAFQWIQEREIHIRKHLKETIPNYVEQGRKIKTILEKI